MALGAFAALVFSVWAFAPEEAHALGGATTGITTGGTTGGQPEPGYIITFVGTDGECISTGPNGSPSVSHPYPTTGNSKNEAVFAYQVVSGGSSTNPPAVGPGQATCSGNIKATFTWDDDGTGLEPPSVVILDEFAAGFGSGETRLAHSDIPPTGGYQDDWNEYVEGTRYVVIQNPGVSFQRVTAPFATASVPPNSQSGLLAAHAAVDYRVKVAMGRIVLAGVIHPIDDKSLVIGQKLTASVQLTGFAPQFLSSAYTWQIDAGLRPFAGYDPTKSTNQKDDYVPPNANQTSFYVAKPKQDALVKCVIATTSPSLTFYVEDDVTAVEPTKSLSDEAIGEFMTIKWVITPQGQQVPAETSIDPTEMKLLNPGKPGGYSISGRLIDPGPPYTSSLLAVGSWNYTQIVTPNVWIESPNGTQYATDNNLRGLDKSFPYPNATDSQGNVIFYVGGPHSAAEISPPIVFRDSPAVAPLTAPVFKAHWSGPFELYMFYKPPGDSMWTPRVKILWTANGECPKTGGTWAMTTNGSALGTTTDWYEHPEWERIHQ